MILVLIMTLLELMIYWTLYSQLFNEKERHSIITCWGLLNNVLHRLTFLPALTSVNLLSFISMKNQECKVRPQIVNVNVDDPVFFPFSIKTSKCSGSCNNINNPLAKLCVPDVVKNLNVKVFNLVSGTNETRRIEWHETCKCKCRFNSSVCNNKQR